MQFADSGDFFRRGKPLCLPKAVPGRHGGLPLPFRHLSLQVVVVCLPHLDVRMPGRELRLENGQAALIQRLGFCVFALRMIQQGQIVQGGCHRGMVFAKALF